VSPVGAPETIHLEPSSAAVLSRSIPRETFASSIEQGIDRARAAVTAAHVPTAGPPFVRFVDLGDPTSVDVGFPLAGPHSVPMLRATVLPGGEVAAVWHREDLDGLIEAVERFVIRLGDVRVGDPWAAIWSTTEDRPEARIMSLVRSSDR
jgi:hypothetical protein